MLKKPGIISNLFYKNPSFNRMTPPTSGVTSKATASEGKRKAIKPISPQLIDDQDCPIFARQLVFHDKENIEYVGDCLTATGPSVIRPHWTESPLSSSGLLANTIAQRMMRNDEQFSSSNIKAFEGLAIAEGPGSSPNEGLWRHCSHQSARIDQCLYVINRLKEREAILEILESSPLELKEIKHEIELLEMIIKYHEPTLSGSLHPITLENNNSESLINGFSEPPSPVNAIRGFMVSLKGPKRGQKACKWQKTAGKISISSMEIMASESKVPINTRIGVFGCTIRIVWGKKDVLFGERKGYRLIDCPPSYFIKEKELMSHHGLGLDQVKVGIEMMGKNSFRDSNWVLLTDTTYK